jgi:putative membrane protein
VSDALVIVSVLVSSCAGALAGFVAGLIPGLHMNNFAAVIVACAGVCAGAGTLDLQSSSAMVVPCFLCAALTAHMFAVAVVSTYLGVPDGDAVSVLPAHRLARAGFGPIAVRSSVDGTLAGVVAASVALLPLSLLLGDALGGYGFIQPVMLPLVIGMSAVLLLSGVPRCGSVRVRAMSLVPPLSAFLVSGVLGLVVMQSFYSACTLPEAPWLDPGTMPRSALLLPLFAGLFGLPNLLIGLISAPFTAVPRRDGPSVSIVPRPADLGVCLLAGVMVGWLPGMTSGTAAAVVSPDGGDARAGEGVESCSRFIWKYSAITSAGAVMSVGALLVISRARSGTMDAVSLTLGTPSGEVLLPVGCMLVSSMLLTAALCHRFMRALEPRLASDGVRRILSSKWAAGVSLAFLCTLTLALTGLRGCLILSAACLLGMLTVRAGVRRVCLMGCMLVPIAVAYTCR